MTFTENKTIGRKALIAACERWVALSAQKRSALLRKNGTAGYHGIMRELTAQEGKAPSFVVFKQRSIVIISLVDDGKGGSIRRRWCYKRGA